MNLNKIFIIGNLTRDPEARSLPSGKAVVSFSVATNRFWTDQQGQKQKQAEFHNVVAFGRLAEIVNQYLKKGSMAFIEGRIQTRNWQDQSGQKRYRTEIIAEAIQLGPRGVGAKSEEGKAEKAPSVEPKEEIETIDITETSDVTSEASENEGDPDKIPF